MLSKHPTVSITLTCLNKPITYHHFSHKYPTVLITLMCRNHRPITYHHCSHISENLPDAINAPRTRRRINMTSLYTSLIFCQASNYYSGVQQPHIHYMSSFLHITENARRRDKRIATIAHAPAASNQYNVLIFVSFVQILKPPV
jgi:hypothetical protein